MRASAKMYLWFQPTWFESIKKPGNQEQPPMCFLLQFSFRILLPLAGEPQDISVTAARMLRIAGFKKSRKVKSNFNSGKLLRFNLFGACCGLLGLTPKNLGSIVGNWVPTPKQDAGKE